MKKINYLIMAISVIVIILGFCLMAGGKTEVEYNPEVMSPRRITVAPIVCMIGFVGMVVGIMFKKKDANDFKQNDFEKQ
ncbi:MAG: DUF3098 domain-containing protein [Bacteroidales bacterium]|nr:DUF3098 domain-containing protein [Bacteroidales bacterium]